MITDLAVANGMISHRCEITIRRHFLINYVAFCYISRLCSENFGVNFPFKKGDKLFISYVLLHILLLAELEMECLLHSENGKSKTFTDGMNKN